jgi:hypothetical protein
MSGKPVHVAPYRYRREVIHAQGNEWYRLKRLQLIQEFGGACQECGSTEDLEFAHRTMTGVQGLGRGRNARTLDVMRNPEAYMLICKRCHLRLDRTGGSM